jgi:hypothetical protein
MQTCFAENAEHYKEFLEDDKEDGDENKSQAPPAETEEQRKAEEWLRYNFAK